MSPTSNTRETPDEPVATADAPVDRTLPQNDPANASLSQSSGSRRTLPRRVPQISILRYGFFRGVVAGASLKDRPTEPALPLLRLNRSR